MPGKLDDGYYSCGALHLIIIQWL